MNTLFDKLNYSVVPADQADFQTCLLVINNPDGSPRWICPAGCPEPYFLKFYNISGWKSRLFALMARAVFAFGLQRLVFHSLKIGLKRKSGAGQPIDLSANNWALFTGTPGPNNKIALFQTEAGRSSFYKIAGTPQARALAGNEAKTICLLNNLQLKSLAHPAVLAHQGDSLRLQDISAVGKRPTVFGALHVQALTEIFSKTGIDTAMQFLPAFLAAQDSLQWIQNRHDDRLPAGLIRKLHELSEYLKDKPLRAALGHGDFTPWNMFVTADKLYAYDWELSETALPVGFDAFHFIMQQGILVERKHWKAISHDIQAAIQPQTLAGWTGQTASDVAEYLRMYLFINTVQQLRLFAAQPVWHQQVAWLLETWNAAISDLCPMPGAFRPGLIIDVFDHLKSKKYAAIKFPNIAPHRLSQYADIDLCLEKRELPGFLAFLDNHPLVSRIAITRKSFMANAMVVLKDGGILSLDIIWQIKWKSLEMMDATTALERAVFNDFGVKTMHPTDTASFVALFYALNNAATPEKYGHYLSCLSPENEAEKLLLRGKDSRRQIQQMLRENVQNTGFKRLRNLLTYGLDTARQMLFSKGLIITFSGVDGAGKSTVIESVKSEIEKKLRRKVVVLRHRPSILPILSVWTKGKENASQDVLNALPRQGKNKSALSSLLRFSYYYLDYLLGQFHVYLKHTRKGDIVLYDRYYFDFINDGKRSNIQLPRALTKAGYRLLLEPDLNFFLYAEPALIRQRKQELDIPTISALTRDYLQLFGKFNKQYHERYFSLENIELQRTIETVMNKTIAAAL